jgi:hypothetical protein
VLAVVREGDPDGANRRRYLALLLDGLRPGAPALPPAATAGWEPPAPPACGERSPAG